ncbi:MAG: LysM peptidoglycan-binding domain-containing protein [Calditrichae bacterium]|nr:LysM peptidoglycan-binding domain-containing protein [Calditrichia bacterium]
MIYQPGKDAVPAVADDGATRHRVRSGESLSVISDRYRVKIADLKRWNNLTSNRIIAGDVLVVRPAPSAAGTNGHQTADAGKTYHTVRSGESLSVIADRYRVKIADIKRWNSLRSNVIFPGNRLVLYPTAGSNLPTGTQVAGIEPLAEIPAGAERSRVSGQVLVQQSISRGESFFYAVSSGNTLSEIAQLFGVSVRDIQSWNRLSSTTLRVGQKLKIVSPRSMKFYKYRVQDGDNIGNIAQPSLTAPSAPSNWLTASRVGF